MEKAKLMQLEIENKRKLPQNVKENISNNIFQNLVAAVIVMAYLVSINIVYSKVSSESFEIYMKYFALGIILATVIDFEIAYRKNSIKLLLIGIELLICGILSLYIPFIYLHTSAHIRNIIMILPAFLIIYYIFKSLVIFKQKQFEYHSNLSDVKEIVQTENKKSYLDEESKKTYREKIEEEEEIRKAIIKSQHIRRAKRQMINKK